MKDWIGNFALSRPVSNCLKPLYHSESSLDTIHMKMRSLIGLCLCKSKSFSKGFVRGPRFETEAQDNSEMPYYMPDVIFAFDVFSNSEWKFLPNNKRQNN